MSTGFNSDFHEKPGGVRFGTTLINLYLVCSTNVFAEKYNFQNVEPFKVISIPLMLLCFWSRGAEKHPALTACQQLQRPPKNCIDWLRYTFGGFSGMVQKNETGKLGVGWLVGWLVGVILY